VGAESGYAAGGGVEGVGGHDDFVAGSDVVGLDEEFEGDGSVDAGDAAVGALVGGVFAFELGDFIAEPPVAAVEDFKEGVAFGVVEDGPFGPGFIVGAYGGAAHEGEGEFFGGHCESLLGYDCWYCIEEKIFFHHEVTKSTKGYLSRPGFWVLPRRLAVRDCRVASRLAMT
jgi:hypothetical protein